MNDLCQQYSCGEDVSPERSELRSRLNAGCAEIIPGLLESIRKAMPKTRDCLRCHIGTLNGRRGECVITNCDKFERLSFKRVSDVKEAA